MQQKTPLAVTGRGGGEGEAQACKGGQQLTEPAPHQPSLSVTSLSLQEAVEPAAGFYEPI